MVGVFVNDAGVWKEITTTAPQVNDAGTLKPAKEIHVNDAGTWKKVWPSAVVPVPTNLRFGYTIWQTTWASYEVQPLWDIMPFAVADGYHLEVTRVGGTATQADKVIFEFDRLSNAMQDRFCGTTGGAVCTYRVRAFKGQAVSAWSAPITTTTPNDPGFARFVAMGMIGDYYGHVYLDIQHDGNPENKQYMLFRQQSPYYSWIHRGTAGLFPGAGVTTTGTDTFPSDHYRGASAGSVATGNQFSDNIEWALHTVNSWGKTFDQNMAGNPFSPEYGNLPNSISWKPSRPADGYIRLNATATNVYRRQPTNSIGWVGGLVRCGGGGGDFLGCWLWHKPALTDLGFANRIRFGYALQLGIGRRNDGGNLNVTFNFGGTAFANGFGGDPRALIEAWGSRTWQRLQGELFTVPVAWAQTYILGSQPHGGACVFATNNNDTYAEFGNIGEIMGGFVNGQFVIHSPWG